MKVTIEIEEKNGKLHIGILESGDVYTAKERRIVGIIAKAFPKSAVIDFGLTDVKSPVFQKVVC